MFASSPRASSTVDKSSLAVSPKALDASRDREGADEKTRKL
jgi:hypothetical protein